MLTLLIYLIVACLVIYCIRLLLPMTGLPANVVTVICIVLAIIFLLWLLSGVGGPSLRLH